MLGIFTVGLLTGGVLSATVLWLFSGLLTPLPPVVRYGIVVVVALLGVARDAGAVRVRLPQNARQIPQDVLQRRLLAGTAQFGFELGTGVRTYVSSSAPYVLAVAVLLVGGDAGAGAGGGFVTALAVGLGFGAGRALTPLLRVASGAAEAWDGLLTRRLRALTVGCCAAIALALAVLVALALVSGESPR